MQIVVDSVRLCRVLDMCKRGCHLLPIVIELVSRRTIYSVCTGLALRELFLSLLPFLLLHAIYRAINTIASHASHNVPSKPLGVQ